LKDKSNETRRQELSWRWDLLDNPGPKTGYKLILTTEDRTNRTSNIIYFESREAIALFKCLKSILKRNNDAKTYKKE